MAATSFQSLLDLPDTTVFATLKSTEQEILVRQVY
jgi:hypothetical protein